MSIQGCVHDANRLPDNARAHQADKPFVKLLRHDVPTHPKRVRLPVDQCRRWWSAMTRVERVLPPVNHINTHCALLWWKCMSCTHEKTFACVRPWPKACVTTQLVKVDALCADASRATIHVTKQGTRQGMWGARAPTTRQHVGKTRTTQSSLGPHPPHR